MLVLTNMMEYVQMVKNGNPEEIVLNMLQENVAQGNPIAGSLIQMINAKDSQGIERIARNVARERGIDFDREFNSFKQMFRNH